MSRLARLLPGSPFSRALLTLVFPFGLFARFTFAVIVYEAPVPVAERLSA